MENKRHLEAMFAGPQPPKVLRNQDGNAVPVQDCDNYGQGNQALKDNQSLPEAMFAELARDTPSQDCQELLEANLASETPEEDCARSPEAGIDKLSGDTGFWSMMPNFLRSIFPSSVKNTQAMTSSSACSTPSPTSGTSAASYSEPDGSSSGLGSKNLFLTVDSSLFVHRMNELHQLKLALFRKFGKRVVLVVPYFVLNDLEDIKKSSIYDIDVKHAGKKALKIIDCWTEVENSGVVLQDPLQSRQSDVFNPLENIPNNGDKLVACAQQYQDKVDKSRSAIWSQNPLLKVKTKALQIPLYQSEYALHKWIKDVASLPPETITWTSVVIPEAPVVPKKLSDPELQAVYEDLDRLINRTTSVVGNMSPTDDKLTQGVIVQYVRWLELFLGELCDKYKEVLADSNNDCCALRVTLVTFAQLMNIEKMSGSSRVVRRFFSNPMCCRVVRDELARIEVLLSSVQNLNDSMSAMSV